MDEQKQEPAAPFNLSLNNGLPNAPVPTPSVGKKNLKWIGIVVGLAVVSAVVFFALQGPIVYKSGRGIVTEVFEVFLDCRSITEEEKCTDSCAWDGTTKTCGQQVAPSPIESSLPTCILSANPLTIDKGQNSTITMTVKGAPVISKFSDSFGEKMNGVISTDGTSDIATVAPQETTLYTVTVISKDGSSNTCSEKIQVNPDCSGNNAYTCTEWSKCLSTNTQTRQCVLKEGCVTGGEKPSEEEACEPPPVSEEAAPPTCTLTATPSNITSENKVTITMNIVSSPPVTETTFSPSFIENNTFPKDELIQTEVPAPTKTTEYKMTAKNAAGSGRCSAIVTVKEKAKVEAPTCTLTAQDKIVNEGASTNLEFKLLTGGPADFIIAGDFGATAKHSLNNQETKILGNFTPKKPASTYTAEVKNIAGTGSCETTVTVKEPLAQEKDVTQPVETPAQKNVAVTQPVPAPAEETPPQKEEEKIAGDNGAQEQIVNPGSGDSTGEGATDSGPAASGGSGSDGDVGSVVDSGPAASGGSGSGGGGVGSVVDSGPPASGGSGSGGGGVGSVVDSGSAASGGSGSGQGVGGPYYGGGSGSGGNVVSVVESGPPAGGGSGSGGSYLSGVGGSGGVTGGGPASSGSGKKKIVAVKKNPPNTFQGGTASEAAKKLHGAYIQGGTGPEVMLYPILILGANGLYYVLRRRKVK